MTEFTADHFEEICSGDPVKTQIESIETVRAAAMKQFWTVAAGGGIGTLVITVVAALFHMPLFVVLLLFIGGLAGTYMIAMRPVEAARKGLKLPMLQALAARGEMTYADSGFQPPYYEGARKALFGSLSETTFTDLFEGRDGQGKAFAIFEAQLVQGSGKSRQVVFSGQMYGFETTKGPGTTVVVPDRGMFNFFKPAKDMVRVKFDENPQFEKFFEVYGDNASGTQGLLASPTLQNRLLELRGKGKLFVFCGGGQALIAVSGPDRFEPGDMFKATEGKTRAKLMFDEVCESLTLLKELRASFG